ncbi:hypothetical protein [Nocardioides xinjiangensis]|uniref:hypothetical protein n=1 Tax=Nocardioides xinjiangensis TaxID=2817376 RepID=UPI001B30A289|nr:hypothetical protein [Nocardioides sp. SYSU D00778]
MSRLPALWRGRAAGGAVLAGIGYAVTAWLDMEPRLLPYVVWSVVVLATAYLVIDTVDVPAAEWQQGPPAPSDRVDEATPDLRVLSSHQQADHPSDALAHRLVALARARDPGLGDAVQRELAGTHRLAPPDIDRILTRIEDVRDPS